MVATPLESFPTTRFPLKTRSPHLDVGPPPLNEIRLLYTQRTTRTAEGTLILCSWLVSVAALKLEFIVARLVMAVLQKSRTATTCSVIVRL